MTRKRKLWKLEIFNTIFIMIVGTFLHFTYEFSNYNNLIGIFSPVNESVWEHLKLLFFPTILTIFIGYILIKDNYPNYLYAKTKGLFIALSFIIIFFYTYTGILGKSILGVDIASFFIAVLILEIYTLKKTLSNAKYFNFRAIAFLTILLIAFLIFTFNPPKIGLFKYPLTNNFGIQK